MTLEPLAEEALEAMSAGRFQDALRFYERRVADLEAAGDPARLHVALEHLVTIFGDLRRHEEGVPYSRRMVAVAEKLGDDGKLGRALWIHGETLLAAREYAEARKVLERAAQIYESAAPESAGRVVALTLLGRACSAVNADAEALRHLWDALGHAHVNGVARRHLAQIYDAVAEHMSKSDANLAVFYYQQAVEIWYEESQQDPDDNMPLCDTLVALGSLLVAGGQLEVGLEKLEVALRLAAEIYQPHDLALVEIIETLASVHAAKGDPEKEKDLRLDAMARRTKALGEEHASMPQALFDLANRFLARGDLDEAERIFRRALAICERVHGPEHVDTARALGGLAEVLECKKDWATCEELARRSLAIIEKARGAPRGFVAAGHQQLGSALLGRGDAALAATHFAKALAIAERIPTFPRHIIEIALEKWLEALERLGRSREAVRVKARLEAVRAAARGDR